MKGYEILELCTGIRQSCAVVDSGQAQGGAAHPMQPSFPTASGGTGHLPGDAGEPNAQHYQPPPGVSQQPSVSGPGQKVYGPPGHPPVPSTFPSSVQAVVAAQQRNNRIAPVNKPNGLDPMALLTERENRLVALFLLISSRHNPLSAVMI